MNYKEQLKTKEWQEKRSEIVNRDNFTCYLCGYHGLLLNVHHLEYLPGKMAWEYPDDMLFTVCRGCHKTIHNYDIINKRIESTRVGLIIQKALK